MNRQQPRFGCVVLGEQSLLIQCCEELLARGHHVQAVVATSRRINDWCAQRDIPCLDHFNRLRDEPAFDYLFSITNLKMLPDWLLAKARRLAINFHDGPLPRYAGLNAPVWALLNGEAEHGITWHQMAEGADTGPILVGRRFGVAPGETAFSLNTKCYQAGLEGFAELIDHLEGDRLQPQPQDLALRSYYGLGHRPPRAALLDWQRPAEELERLVRALDFGPYPNPVMLPKVEVGGRQLLVRQAQVSAQGAGAVGAIEHHCAHTLTVRCAAGALKLLRLTDLQGEPVDVAALLQAAGLGQGDCLPPPLALPALDERIGALSRHEEFWRRRLQRMEPVELPFAAKDSGEHGGDWRELALAVPAGTALAALALLLGRLAGKRDFALACVPAAAAAQPDWFGRFFDTVVPLPVTIEPDQPFAALSAKLAAELEETEKRVGYLRDLRAREPELKAAPDCAAFPVRVARVPALEATAAARLGEGAALTVLVPDNGDRLGLLADRSRLPAAGMTALLEHLQALLAEIAATPERPVAALNLLTGADREQLARFNEGGHEEAVTPPPACVHHLFERQAALTPERTACLFEGESITYRELNRRANRLAGYLRGRGVATGDLVGVMVERSIDMLVALYAVHKAGAAYVPLDPVYPHDRLAYMAADAGLRVLITQRAFAGAIAVAEPVVLEDVAAAVAAQPADDAGVAVSPADLAYVIYTSGSTGKPKGVMVEHRNVVNFFAGMDARIDAQPGTWLAVTSISFDISVLELFWTLARGFTVVLYADAVRQKAAARGPSRRLEFGFFYWNVAKDENQYDRDKYRLLLEGARFADEHGFNAVWTPERHFAAFGGLFPNPSVTSAALATITRNVALRAGSCVVPLHSPIRVAEEWAVVDNLSNGRVGLSIAAGWAPPDFAIRPENFADAKRIMFESAEQVRRLWRGETLMFPGPQGGEVPVRTLPRPLQPELPLWVTTAGNIDTFVQAAKAGANVLTHLLGQSVEEVAEKVRAYRRAWTEAGHAGRGVVTLMLHTFVGPDQAAVESAVRGPLKEYLRSAMNLVKAAAWQFPTFKKMSEEQGKTLDEFFAAATAEDLDGLLEFAFQRYFHDSGLFGTPDSCLAMVERVAGADVDEIACLIDFGIDTQQVLDHLPWLDRLREAAQRVQPAAGADEDYSLPALFRRHAITHFQCTPSMATMLMADPATRPGLAGLRQMMVGGEAFPPELARSLAACVGGRVTNMYGPTETTIWSAVGDVERGRPPVNNVSIGRPLPNQRVYILDERQQPLPVGVAGELVIGGAGVVRGYWQRPELTEERFLPDRFGGGRMYRTGDLARWLPDGRIECLGRVDHQVKIRGYRVELGEIEALLRNCDGVAEAAVVLREDVPGDQRLVAYLRPAPGARPAAETLKQALRRQLPEFMVPSAYVELAALPLTPNGKIDRKALPAPQAAASAAAHAPPQSEAEAMIAAIWQRALGVERVGRRDNFFDIGGHSLLVVQVLKELREQVSRPIQMTDLFQHTTVEALARFIGAEEGGPDQPLDRGLARAEARRAALDRRRRR